MANVVNWIEIPAVNLERAQAFYEKVLGGKSVLWDMPEMDLGGIKMAGLPMEGEGVGGALCMGDNYKPTMDGPIIYLNGGDDLSGPLTRVTEAGGKVIVPKTKITDEIGYFAMFIDSEGNRMAFHSQH